VTRKIILRTFERVEHKDDIDWIKRCTEMEVEGIRLMGLLRKTWWDVVKEHVKSFEVSTVCI